MSGATLPEKEFLQHITQNLSHMAWFLGAGASRAAGMPSAWDITWETGHPNASTATLATAG